MAEPEALALVTPAEGRGVGEYHFSKCPMLIRLGQVKLDEIWSHGAAREANLSFCPVCSKMEKEGRWRVKPATMPMPVPQPPPKPKKFFRRYSGVYHRYETCPAWLKTKRDFERVGGIADAIPVERFEDREEAEMFWRPCPECVKADDLDAY
jgi:hypothetical protein